MNGPHGQMSREFALDVDATGRVIWADERAERLVGIRAGQELGAAVIDPAKLDRLLADGAPGVPWELSFRRDERALTASLFVDRGASGAMHLLGSLVPQDYGDLSGRLNDLISELAGLQRQTQRQKQDLERQYAELQALHRDLDDSGRGVRVLQQEVDDKALALERAGEIKAKIVAHVSHEFRTPLNSILGISRLLLDELDGPLNDEQRKQLGLVRRSAESLGVLVDDMLDISRLESGRIALRVTTFTVTELFAALRGIMRPLATNPDVRLVFEDGELGELTTDDGKVAQILRNYISNALKFTVSGEVRISARALADGQVVFVVADTGIGISESSQTRLFQEFSQIDNPLQANVKGTGLGLAIVRRLGEVLGGSTSVSSEPGIGSRFYLMIPRVHPDEREYVTLRAEELDPARSPVLVVEDDRQTLFLYQRYLRGSGFQVIPARSVDEARATLETLRPAAIVLDVMLDGESSWSFLKELKAEDATREIPTLVVTVTHREETARALGADEFFPKPIDGAWLVRKLATMARSTTGDPTLLVVDDDEATRYLLNKLLTDAGYRVLEARDGSEGVRMAREHVPHAILLDFVMPGMSAFDVLDELKSHTRTREIPVFIHTSKDLAEHERSRLAVEAKEILNKSSLTREVAIARIRDALEKAGVRAGRRE